MVSGVVWYEIDYEHTVSQATTPEITDVEVHVWANPTTNGGCSRAIWCPMLIRCEDTGPLILGVRLVDPTRQATSAQIHSASLHFIDGSTVELSLVPERSEAPGQTMLFFQNASEFIVDTFHSEALTLLQPASLRLDVEVTVGDKPSRRKLVIEIAPTILRRSGWAVVTG